MIALAPALGLMAARLSYTTLPVQTAIRQVIIIMIRIAAMIAEAVMEGDQMEEEAVMVVVAEAVGEIDGRKEKPRKFPCGA